MSNQKKCKDIYLKDGSYLSIKPNLTDTEYRLNCLLEGKINFVKFKIDSFNKTKRKITDLLSNEKEVLEKIINSKKGKIVPDTVLPAGNFFYVVGTKEQAIKQLAMNIIGLEFIDTFIENYNQLEKNVAVGIFNGRTIGHSNDYIQGYLITIYVNNFKYPKKELKEMEMKAKSTLTGYVSFNDLYKIKLEYLKKRGVINKHIKMIQNMSKIIDNFEMFLKKKHQDKINDLTLTIEKL